MLCDGPMIAPNINSSDPVPVAIRHHRLVIAPATDGSRCCILINKNQALNVLIRLHPISQIKPDPHHPVASVTVVVVVVELLSESMMVSVPTRVSV